VSVKNKFSVGFKNKMGNMSYCRFENTYEDLQDCYDALGEKSLDELSETEKKYAKKLIKMCRDIADDFLDDEDDE
jgi:TfoX/Sxy family transcriptional regulator of competence genes